MAALEIALDFVGFVLVVVAVVVISSVYIVMQLIKQAKGKRNKDNHGEVKQ